MKWAIFTRRTNDPKLAWLENELTKAGIPHRRNGESWHAPILAIDESRENEAWDILNPVDNIEDDDIQFVGVYPHDWEPGDGSHPEDCPVEFWS